MKIRFRGKHCKNKIQMGDPAIPDVHGDAVAVVVDAGGDGEEFEAAGVAVLVVGAVSVVVEAVHEDAPVVNLTIITKCSRKTGKTNHGE